MGTNKSEKCFLVLLLWNALQELLFQLHFFLGLKCMVLMLYAVEDKATMVPPVCLRAESVFRQIFVKFPL